MPLQDNVFVVALQARKTTFLAESRMFLLTFSAFVNRNFTFLRPVRAKMIKIIMLSRYDWELSWYHREVNTMAKVNRDIV